MSAGTVKAGLVAFLVDALQLDTAVQVTFGNPGPTTVPDIVAVRDVRPRQDGEEEVFLVELKVSCYAAGSNAQATATARAYSLLDTIHGAILDDPTIGGVCRVAALAAEHRMAETMAYDGSGRLAIGRLSEITATVETWSDRPLVGSLGSAHSIP